MSTPNKRDSTRGKNCCCDWLTFKDGFLDAYARWFDAPPTDEKWKAAVKDWRSGNTGYEAAHNAQRRVKEAAEKAAAKPLVWLGGRNWAEAGSDLAKRYGEDAT